MSDKTDLEDLARRYLDLWREQVSATASDPQFMETLSRAFAALGQVSTQASQNTGKTPNMFPWLTGLPMQGAGEGATDFDAVFRAFTEQGVAEPSPRTEAATAESDNGGQPISELERRVAALEERIAELEPKPRKKRKRPARRAEK
tara:strand:- start:1343 stop:1780 length:438 start_codon:yes stop_codon:yes gene_type:complete